MENFENFSKTLRFFKFSSSFREFEQTNSNFCCLVTRKFRKFSKFSIHKVGQRTQRAVSTPGSHGFRLKSCLFSHYFLATIPSHKKEKNIRSCMVFLLISIIMIINALLSPQHVYLHTYLILSMLRASLKERYHTILFSQKILSDFVFSLAFRWSIPPSAGCTMLYNSVQYNSVQ
jgi:hypothetical protein